MKWWHLNCPMRTEEIGYKPTRDSKDKHSNVCEERPRKVFWDGKVVFTFCRYLWGGRQQYICCCCWCPGLDVVLQMSTPTTDTNQQSHSWKLSAHDRLLCWIQLYQHKQFSRDRGWIITVLTEVTDPTGPLKKIYIYVCTAPYFILSKSILAS